MPTLHWSERAKTRMKQLGMTQRNLADNIGLSQPMVARFLKRRNEPSDQQMQAIAKVLSVDVHWLAQGENPALSEGQPEGGTATSVGERLRYAREQLGLTIEQIAEQLGLSANHVQEMEANVAALQAVDALSAVLQVSTDWLLYGRTPSKGASRVHWVPVIEWEHVLHWEDALQRLPHDSQKVPIDEVVSMHCFALRVQGDAMIGVEHAFPPGSLIVVDADVKPDYNDFVVAINTSTQAATFKQYIQDGGQAYLKPLNSRYPLVLLTDDYRLCGTVITVYHKVK